MSGNSVNSSQTDSPKLLKASDVANRLNVSRSLAYRLLQDGSIPAVRIGTALRVRPQELEAFIESHISGSDPPGFPKNS